MVPGSKELKCSKTFDYHGYGQLLTEVTVYTDGIMNNVSYIYDGNCNLLPVTRNVAIVKRTYNPVGQRIDSGFTYDTNGRLRTDDKGRTYTYLPNDRLKSTKGVRYAYRPDGSLASLTNDNGQTSFFYDSGVVNSSKNGVNATSYRLEPGRRLESYDKRSDNLTYYVENNGSSVLTIPPSATEVDEYGAYGKPTDAATQDSPFGYRQEYAEPSSGLVYLRSRLYQSDHSAFITMDGTRKENRYAYCGGDPVNRSDITGHSAGGAMAAGIVVGTFMTTILGAFTVCTWRLFHRRNC